MEQKRRVGGFCILFLAAAVFVLSGGVGVVAHAAGDGPECAKTINKSVSSEAELVELSCSFKKWAGVKTLHFKVALKNLSHKPRRYRVNIFLDNGRAVGGLIPRKTQKGLVQPGQTATFVYPVKNQTRYPESIDVRVTTMD